MPSDLTVSIGQYSDKGAKETNQDFHGALIPDRPALTLKGISLAVADGISTSNVSQVAAETAIKTFLTDYYCTPDSWPVKTSAERVISATNSWLHSQTKRDQRGHDMDKGYVCTFSALVLKSRTAYIFHIGDSRIYRLSGNSLEQLTEDHRLVVSSQQSYLSRALGINPRLEIDCLTVALKPGDHFVLATDGVYEFTDASFVAKTITRQKSDLDSAAKQIVSEAQNLGSQDNLTIQVVRIDSLPDGEVDDFFDESVELPFPPLLEPRMEFDGYRIVRQLHASSRSHVYLANDNATDELAVIKIPSIDLRGDTAYRKRFMMEEWIARRLNSAHVLKNHSQARKRNYFYLVTEYVDGQTLTQWMIDHPKPELDVVRGLVEQIAKGLRSFHRMEMVHQDLRPENIVIDKTGTAKIIDFGSTKVAGVLEATALADENEILGTAQYTAPEYYAGDGGTFQSDIFSLGVITYQMLTGKLPYGAKMAQARTKSQQRKVGYISAHNDESQIPLWIDGALKKAVHADPLHRYDTLSEFLFDLSHPNEKFLGISQQSLLERNPLLFWKCLSLALACVIFVLLVN